MGRYVTNAEFKEINRLLQKKDKKSGCMGCFGCLGLIVIVLILLVILSALGEKGTKGPSATPAENVSSPAASVPSSDPDLAPAADTPKDERVEVKIIYAMREWETERGKVMGRFVKGEEGKIYLFVAGKGEIPFDPLKMSKRDNEYLSSLADFPSKIEPASGVSEREWTYFSGRKPFKGTLLYATERLVLIKTKKGNELHYRQDLSVPDWNYLESVGY